MTIAKSDSIRSILKRVYQLLNARERKRSTLLFLSILANSIVEILGLAVIVPVIGLVIQPETIQTSATLRTLYEAVEPFGINTPSRFLIALCFVLIGAFLFKAVFGLAVNLFQTRFSFTVAHRLSGQMWSHHFSQSLERMRGTDSGRVLAEINTWPVNFATSFMVGGLMILTEVSVISLIATGLLFYNSVVFLSIAGLLAIGAFIIRKVTKRRLGVYSATRQKVEPRTNTLITNAVRGFLEVITFRASDAVRNAYLKDRWTILRIVSNTSVLALSPSKLYEVLAVIAVAGSIIIALLQGTPEASFLQLLSFMAISAYRIMPSMSRLNSVIIRMREQQHVLETMEVGAQTNADNSASNQSPINSVANSQNQNIDIELNDITLSYEALQKPVIEHLQHTFSAAGLHAIVGPSGSGKSTLVSSILGLHKAKNGHVQMRVATNDVQILGADIDLHSWILNVGYLSQQPFLFAGSVRDNLTLRVPGATVNEDLVNRLIQQLSLSECLGSSPLEFQLQEGGSNLSGGQQQRLALLRALQIQRPVLILDEATSALDHALRDVVFELLRKRADDGCNIILVTHDKALASKCDDVLDLGAQTKASLS
jgi:ABC-type multidrug transport system fused ATPase/permease subunit